MFDRADGALEVYKPSIQDNNKNAVLVCQEKSWSHKLKRQASIRTANRIRKKLVISRMEGTWVFRIKNETTLFKHVTLRDILDHLGATSTGVEAIEVI